MTRRWAVPAIALALGLAAIGAIALLQERSVDRRASELKLAQVENELNKLQTAPFKASPRTGGSPAVARGLMRTGETNVARTLAELLRHSPPPALRRVSPSIRANFATLAQIYRIGASGQEYGRRADRLAAVAGRSNGAIKRDLDEAGRSYHQAATRSSTQSLLGSAAMILVLLAAFGFLYRRSAVALATAERLAHENELLLATSRQEALSDALTGLRNRRALVNDLAEEIPGVSEDRPLLLALFDLDGFKQYNDTFGHPAGDALLARLGERLEATVTGRATAYRMGGDEFCIVAGPDCEDTHELVRIAADSLSEEGDAFEVGCSYGVVHVPDDADTPSEALRVADQRMYEHKAARASTGRESADVLLQVLSERSAELHDHINDVAELARVTAIGLGLPDHEARRIELAAALHDVGKTAIPDTILDKPGKLDPDEWEFIRNHTLIGERIVRAAPSLAHTAELVRSSHERFDGHGYPDGLASCDIPLGARIIGVCDAFHAMVSERPYRLPMTVPEALAELRRNAGTQFDPDVAEVFCAKAEELRRLHLQAA